MSDRFLELLSGRQDALVAKLNTSRRVNRHPTTKGDASELNWLEVLQDFLPGRYAVDRAAVIDSRDGESEQLDIVIYDRQYTPLVLGEGDVKYIPAESVYAVFESKQELNAKQIKYAGKKAASVRRLHRTSADIHWAGGTLEAQEPGHILAGILTTDCGWKKKGLGAPFEKALTTLDGEQQLDLGCVATKGAFDVVYHDGEATFYRSQNDAMTLTFFLMRLFVRLQSLATARAIDMNAYVGSLEGWPES